MSTTTSSESIVTMLSQIIATQRRLEILLTKSYSRSQQWFSTEEVASEIGRRPFTVRQWCRLGRLQARKRVTGRGGIAEWEIPLEELERYRNHGLRELQP